MTLLAALLIMSLTSSSLSYHITTSESGSVSGEEIVHYTLSFTEPVVVVLISDQGDVDLYASPTHVNSRPDSDDHEVNSASCGMDMLVLIMSSELRKYTLGIYGHVRYDKSLFTLYVIKPSPQDIRQYQVWDVDPKTMREVLLIDADPMLVMNDLKLTEIIETLQHKGHPAISGSSKLSDTLHFIGVVLLKIIEIVLDILV